MFRGTIAKLGAREESGMAVESVAFEQDGESPSKGRKWDAILLAARGEFSRIGYRAATIRGIAEAANVSTRTLYNYFDDKLGLFTACLDDRGAHFPKPEWSQGANPEAALRAYIVEVLRHLSSAGSLQLSLMIFRDGDACPEMNLAAKDNHQRYFLMPLAAFLRDLGVEEAKSVDLARLVSHMATSEWQRRILFGEPPLTNVEIQRHAEMVVGVLMNGVGIRRARDDTK